MTDRQGSVSPYYVGDTLSAAEPLDNANSWSDHSTLSPHHGKVSSVLNSSTRHRLHC